MIVFIALSHAQCLHYFTGSGGSSSLASSPSLRGSCAWPRPSSPLRPVVGDAPRSRLSLYEGARELPTSAKMRHSVCLEPRDAQDMARKQKNRHSICVEPRDLARTRASLCLEPRNPLLDLMESVEAIPTLISHEDSRLPSSARTSPSKSEGKLVLRTGGSAMEEFSLIMWSFYEIKVGCSFK